MTLSFTQKWPKRMKQLAGQPNYFVEKIWESIYYRIDESEIIDEDGWHDQLLYRDINIFKEFFGLKPKLHTIREDPKHRWRADMDIHYVINNRTKNRFQFAPVLKCVSVQQLEITWILTEVEKLPILVIGNTHFYSPLLGIDKGMKQLAINDGFPSVEAFFDYFNKDYVGKIIHWTDLKY